MKIIIVTLYIAFIEYELISILSTFILFIVHPLFIHSNIITESRYEYNIKIFKDDICVVALIVVYFVLLETSYQLFLNNGDI